jgi:hypothetical protein
LPGLGPGEAPARMVRAGAWTGWIGGRGDRLVLGVAGAGQSPT